jgi:hypothetical protein
MAKKQKASPLFIKDCPDYENMITKKTLSFDAILSRNYLNVYGLSSEVIDLIKLFKELRNEIHLPEGGSVDNIEIGRQVILVINYINDKLVEVNRFISKQVLLKPMFILNKI